ncbi:MAG TPA: ATP-dependent zinc metalloprotease FtsH [Actinomycetota bacterium]|jgi:cell division protease FtsH
MRAAAPVARSIDGARRVAIAIRHRLGRWALRRRRARVSRPRRRASPVTYVLVVTLAGLLALFWGALSYLRPDVPGRALSIGELNALAEQRRLVSAAFLDEDSVVTGSFTARPADVPNEARTEGPAPSPEAIAPDGSGRYWTAYPSSGAVTAILVEMATTAGADVEVEPQPQKKAVRMIATFLLPLMILANLFALLLTAGKGSASGIGEVEMFGSIGKGRGRRRKGASAVTFGSVAGADEAVAELKEVVDYLKEPERYADVGATPPKGVLLFGPPGCGKTLLAKAVAGEAGVPFFSVAGAEFVESLVGVGAARVRDLFQRVRAVAPAIVFIDELDAAGRKRGHGGGGGSDEREQTLNQLLVDMDGFDVSSGIVVIGATNRPDILDPALLRPGRFDRHVTIDQPDAVGRQLILELHSANKPIAPSVDFEYLARRTPGFSGADLANVVNEAALLTVREDKTEIEMPELAEAVQRVLAGPKKRGRVLSPEERKRAAYHESGHALVAAASGGLADVHRVTILARGRAVGGAAIQREGDAVLLTTDQLFARLVTAMAGLAAEVLVFGVPSTGAEQDLSEATEMARDMVGRYGMGTRRRRLLSPESDGFLGDELALAQISGQTHHEMEVEIDELLQRAEDEAMRVLSQHREVLDGLAERLEVEETLEGTDLEGIVALVRPEVSLFGGVLGGGDPDGLPTTVEGEPA